jgi:hypothetical protein
MLLSPLSVPHSHKHTQLHPCTAPDTQPRTGTHFHTHIHTHTHTHTHTQNTTQHIAHTHLYACTPMCTGTHMCAHMNTHPHTCKARNLTATQAKQTSKTTGDVSRTAGPTATRSHRWWRPGWCPPECSHRTPAGCPLQRKCTGMSLQLQ